MSKKSTVQSETENVETGASTIKASAREHRRAYMREYNAKNREAHRLYNKQWYKDHRGQAKTAAREYRLKNPEKTRIAAERWRQNNKLHMLEYNKNYQTLNRARVAQTARDKRLDFFSRDPKVAWLHYTFQSAKGRAQKKGLPYDQDLSGLDLPDFCPVLGISLKYRERRKKPAPDSPSLDRVVPQRGYVLSNLRVISWRANVLKRDASIEEVRRVLAYMEECLSQKETT